MFFNRELPAAVIAVAALAALATASGPAISAEVTRTLPTAKLDPADGGKSAVAVLAGGCFWGVEGVLAHVKGVKRVTSGYHGGSKSTATYDRTNDGNTGHAEAVRVVYDPTVVSYGTLLRVVFSVITDPTQLNRQGPDTGTQYRSAIVPMNETQAKVARAYLAKLSAGKHFSKPIVTKVEAYKGFYPAEAYHQDFMVKNPRHGYIQHWDAPKLAALQTRYPALYSAKAAP